jgi:hypothetical protein
VKTLRKVIAMVSFKRLSILAVLGPVLSGCVPPQTGGVRVIHLSGGGPEQPTAPPSLAPGPGADWVLLNGQDCWAFRTFRFVGGVVAWSGACQNHLASGTGMLSWWSGTDIHGQVSGSEAAMVFGNLTQGRVDGSAYGQSGYEKFKGIFHDGFMVSTDPPYGPTPRGIAFAPSSAPSFGRADELGSDAPTAPR